MMITASLTTILVNKIKHTQLSILFPLSTNLLWSISPTPPFFVKSFTASRVFSSSSLVSNGYQEEEEEEG